MSPHGLRRILVEPKDICGSRLRLEGPEVHHILNVLRKKAGDVIEATDGQGHDFMVSLEKTFPHHLEGTILERKNHRDPSLDVHLFQAIPKSQRMDWIIEKAVELGARTIQPLWTQRSVVKPDLKTSSAKLDRWRRIAGEALAQSGSCLLYAVEPPCSLSEAASKIERDGTTLVAWEKEKQMTLKEAVQKLVWKNRSINVFVGPEGGLSTEEIKLLKNHGAHTVSLGERTLRSETAPLMILSALLYESFL